MAMGEQPYSMIVQMYVSFPSTDKWDNVPLNLHSFRPKGKTLPRGGHLNCMVLWLHQTLPLIHHMWKLNFPAMMTFFFCRYTKQGSLKDHTDCAPKNGYYFLPLYDKGEYILKVRHFDEGQELLLFRILQSHFTKFVKNIVAEFNGYNLVITMYYLAG